MTATTPGQAINTGAGGAPEDSTDQQSHHHATCLMAREDFTAWLTASCERQSLPVTITDPSTLAAVATLLH